MTRFVPLYCLFSLCIGLPALAETVPQPRPEGLVERSRAAAARAAAVEAEVEGEVNADTIEVTQATAVSEPEAVSEVRTLDRATIAAQITGAIRDCWDVSDLSPEARAVRIWLAFNTTPEGTLIRETIEMTRFENGSLHAAEEALMPAFAAIMRCGDNGLELPPETHPIWQRVEIAFDAASMVPQ